MLNNSLKIWKSTPKIIKFTISFLGALFVSALGTPIWNRILKPVILFIIDISFNFVFQLFKYIETETYTNIANMSLYVWIFDIKIMVIAILLMPSLMMLTYIHQKSKINEKYNKEIIIKSHNGEKLKKEVRLLRKISYISLFITILLFSATLAQDIYTMQMKIKFENKVIEARPYLTDKEFYLINAKFKKVKSKKDYNNIIKKIDKTILEKQSIIY